MQNHHLPVVLGLTSALSLFTVNAVEAAAFNFDSIQNIKTRPIESDTFLSFFGAPKDGQGYTAFFNLDPTASDVGHVETSRNSPGNIAPYYTTGRNASPEEPTVNTTRSASLIGNSGFSLFGDYIAKNNIALSDIGIGYGQKEGVSFTKTWNLGDDIQGQDWFGGPDTTLEERIYQANPNDVEIFLTVGNQKIIDFGYTPFYSFLEYGETPLPGDDSEAVYSEPIFASKYEGLAAFESGLADAFLTDVSSAGGSVQVVYQDVQVEDIGFTTGNGYGVLRLPFPVDLRAVSAKSVPEPSAIFGMVLLVGVSSWVRRQQSA